MSLSWLAPVPYQTYRDLRHCHQHHPWCLGRHQDRRAQQPTATDVVPTPRHAAGASALVASTSGAATGARQRRSCRCLVVQKSVSDLQWSLAVGCCLPSSNRKPITQGLGPASCKSVHQAHMTRRPRLCDAPTPTTALGRLGATRRHRGHCCSWPRYELFTSQCLTPLQKASSHSSFRISRSARRPRGAPWCLNDPFPPVPP